MARRSYAEAGLLESVLEMLGEWLRGLADLHGRVAALGMPWSRCSTPFLREEDGRLVGHVGALEQSLVVLGERVPAVALHAVYVRPEFRGRGHFRALMQEALAHCDARAPLALLTTDQPELYGRFGFRTLSERHAALAQRPGGEAGALHALEWSRAEHCALIDRLLRTREPVSQRLGVIAEEAAFKFNTALRTVHYLPALDAALVLRTARETLHIEDIVAPKLPDLETVLRALPAHFERVLLDFAPDRFALPAQPAPRSDRVHVMARGPLACEGSGQPFMLPPTAHA